ncbi:MAG: gliding motility-associated C-terminal domain-containing protein [Bacteroidales bacterium]|nr:gliding motility-associated C-terminal domain-containing protein [Bacteroidales bacterium]
MKSFTTLIIFFIFSLGVQAQQAVIECLEVSDINGSVIIRFSCPASVTKYKILRANTIDSDYFWVNDVSGNSTVYTDSEINASSQSYAYKIEAIIGSQGTGLSDPVRTLFLEVNNLETGLVELNWNNPGFQPTSVYEIYVKGADNSYYLKGITPNTYFTDTLSFCKENIFYRINVITGNCDSKSNLKGGLFQDNTAPANIIPKNTTLDTETGEIILSWYLPPQEDADIAKYQIWILDNDGGFPSYPEAEVEGYENLEIHLPNENVCDTTITFSITAQDSCGNSSNHLNTERYIKTVNLYAPSYDICDDKCTISWDSIFWYNETVEGIRIYRNEDGGEFEILTEVDGTEKKVVTYGYERGIKYSFYIEAYSQSGRTSSSCLKKITGKKPKLPTHTWLRYASDKDGAVELKWQINPGVHIPEYAISRSDDGSEYQIIDTLRLTAGQVNRDTIFTYLDKESTYYKEQQYYKIAPFDSCLNLTEPSNIAVSIHATVIDESEGKALIEWTADQTMESLDHYEVFRIIDNLVYGFPVYTAYPGDELKYIDDYGSMVPLSSRVGYHVEAIGKINTTITETDTTRSNRNYLTKVSNVFIPTGYRPNGGVTEIYKPISLGIKNKNYSFKILNRWGQIIFETNQTVIGWDGTYLGEHVPLGVYVYIIEYETIYNKSKKQSGTFVVLP